MSKQKLKLTYNLEKNTYNHKSIKRLTRGLVRPSSLLVGAICFGLLIYLVLPPMIRLNTLMVSHPKTSDKTKIIKKITPAKTRIAVIPSTPQQPKVTTPPPATKTQTPIPQPVPVSAPAPKPIAVVKPAPSSSVNTLTPSTTSTSPSSSSSGSSTTGTSGSSTTGTSGSSTTGTSGSSGSSSSSSSSGSTEPPSSVSYTSSNWSGYLAANNATYSAISAQWTATSPTGNGTSTTADATWIGIGGVTTSDLIQVGTENQVSASGQVLSAAFYELLPDASVEIRGFNVTPGNNISASIDEVSSNEWTIDIDNLSTGQTYSTTVSYDSSESSAEWIEEDPSDSSGNLIPFDNFGTVPFSDGLTTMDGSSVNIYAANSASITMLNGSGQDIAVPSDLSDNGSVFSVTREN